MHGSGERMMMMMMMMVVDDFVVDARMVMIKEDDVMVAVMMVNPCLYAQDVSRKLLGYYGHLMRVMHSC